MIHRLGPAIRGRGPALLAAAALPALVALAVVLWRLAPPRSALAPPRPHAPQAAADPVAGGPSADDPVAGDTPTAPGRGAPRGDPGAHAPQALAELLLTDPPARDLLDLAARLGTWDGRLPDQPRPAPGPHPCPLGHREPFWVQDIQGQRYFQIQALVAHVAEGVCFWVQDGQPFDQPGLQRGGDTFAGEIVPRLRDVLGDERPLRDNPHESVHVLHHESIPGVAGFFSSSDTVPPAVDPYSNGRELFYVNLQAYRPGSYDYLSLLAHEFQHMVHFRFDPNESAWVNEGLSELAAHLAGYGAQNGAAFFADPDTPLLEWQAEAGANTRHYAVAYAFFAYLKARFGEPVVGAVVRAPRNGPAGVEQALAAVGRRLSFDGVFRDWMVANLVGGLGRVGALDARHDYAGYVTGAVRPEALPQAGASATVGQYAARYHDVTALVADGQLALDFQGDAGVYLVEKPPAGDGPVWWSGRGDNANSRLTRALDLSGADSASLSFWLWHDLEAGWDHAYLSASVDGGESWARLRTSGASDDNVTGTNYGGGITGWSGGWYHETVDLSALAGGPALLRFEVVTDDTVSLTGLALHEVAVDAAGAESYAAGDPAGHADWTAEGWLLVQPLLPQRWSLLAVVDDPSGLTVTETPVGANGTARLELSDVPPRATVTVAVAAMTPGTRRAAAYHLGPAAP